jgi:hypothetical protein
MSTINEDRKDNAAVSRNKDFHGDIHHAGNLLMDVAVEVFCSSETSLFLNAKANALICDGFNI